MRFTFRDIGRGGLVTDTDPYNLPGDPMVWSGANNVYFPGPHVARLPILRKYHSSLPIPATDQPAHVRGFRPDNTGGFYLLVATTEGRLLVSTTSSNIVDRTPTSGPLSGLGRWSSTVLGGVLLVAREGHGIYYWQPAMARFAPLSGVAGSEWQVGWQAPVVASFLDYAVVLGGVTGTVPNAVRWAHPTTYGTPPTRWDVSDTTSLAGENVLTGLDTPLIGAWSLRDALVLYSGSQVWEMRHVGAPFVFTFRPLFTDGAGLIGRGGCVVERGGMHYVFGAHDIWVHDGNTKESIAAGRVRDKVFSYLIRDRTDDCFAFHDTRLDLIYFCYPSIETEARFSFNDFPGAGGCNRAAVFCPASNTWSFADLPFVRAASTLLLDLAGESDQFDSTPLTYDNAGGTYDSGGTTQAVTVLCGSRVDGALEGRVWALDRATRGSALALERDLPACPPATLERVGITFSREGLSYDDYLVVTRIVPQIRSWGARFSFQVGGSLTPILEPEWSPTVLTFDPALDYQLELIEHARYLAIRATETAIADFEFAAAELEVHRAGR